ncbi:MAG: type II toxin-antitoxin system PemK/MazF family toxin [Gammaproteobacteria bacterium]
MFFHNREVWWCALGANLGDEQDGKGKSFICPIIVLRKFTKTIFWALPLTTKRKTGTYYYRLSSIGGKEATVTLNQLRLIDARRLSHKIGDVSKEEFRELKQKLKALLP